ncbi:putative type II secretion system protein F [Botrimarina hoheduenensis]|uniref:Putative type II secretion system protein F n=1 Tax=Botrimarina hoheduenensis TaxID=2528000 RepID=A0A5C5VPS4_9BACT|nr:putative type II secretion system protein F [Botrimarina hoheduenensis]
MKETTQEAEATAIKKSGFSRRTRITAQERVGFTSQLAMMTGAGLGVAQALESLARQCPRAALAVRLKRLHEDVMGGASFSAALRQQPDLFDEAYTATVGAGEASGKMSEVLAQLAELNRAEMKLRRTLRGMLIYPVMLTIVSLLVVSTLVVFVLPRFATIFDQYDLTLPLVTRVLIGIAEELRARWWLWGMLAGGGVAGLIAARVTEQGRRFVDTVLVRSPGIGPVVRTVIGARACRMLGLLIESGVPLLDCLRLLKRSISNRLFGDLADKLEEAVTNGRSLSDALANNEVLPPSAAEMIATAEKTGRLGEVNRLLGAHYDEEGEAAARQIVSAIEPLVTIVMGGVVATVVMAVMLPVFDIATLAQR